MNNSVIQSSGYPIFIGDQVITELNLFLKTPEFIHSRIFALVDEHTVHHCLPLLSAQLERFEEVQILEMESGEASKNIEVCNRLWKALGEMGADRHSLLLNLGGGVISDMGGFVASTFKRGISFVNIPSTLLSQVDASVGGKVGVDLDHIKNEIGLFSSPRAVFIYPDFLKTLSRREMMSGFAEVVKHALIADSTYWNFVCSANVADGAVWVEMVERSVLIKNTIVEADPREKKGRKALNFGHTIGHAIESYFLESAVQNLLHGEAVAIGMISEAYISHVKNGLSAVDLESIRSFILEKFGHIPLEPFADHRILELMSHDKKNKRGELNFTLLNAIGSCDVDQTASLSIINDALRYYREAKQLAE
jgi:3-dehydroquinate synthase